MAEETGTQLNRAINEGVAAGLGLGQSVGKYLDAAKPPFAQISVAATAWRLQIPVTVHVAIGTDIIHMHPQASGAAIGEGSLRDFKYFVSSRVAPRARRLPELRIGGGAAGGVPQGGRDRAQRRPIARRPDDGEPGFPAALSSADQRRHAADRGHGKGYSLTGHHEMLIPLLAAALI